ncbi:MAG: hypothetical protein HRU50_10610 [Winogradskyella sp.]|uniref:hypothetical protein n=1 Tax=Winogradskyella sp. TaxID=1883156 RepID=UPI0025F0095A|nr:hypothetical protein [Winogradskyella sp.]NRB60372.1 hypothetical protein [Winogradskyella sp.]
MKLLKQLSIFIITLSLTNCVQETHLKTINFKIDLSTVEVINNPSVKGEFTNPSWEKAITLTDSDNDGIYEGKVEVRSAQFGMQFKCFNNDEFELQGSDNRFITFEYKPETIIYEATYNNREETITRK